MPIVILKLSPLDSPDVGGPEKYPQHMPEVLRKWFRGPRTSLTLFWNILLLKTGHQTIFSKCLEEGSSGDNFRIIIGTNCILWQEISLGIVFYRLKHETHVEYSTVLGLRGHFKYPKFFLGFKSKIRFHSFVGLDLKNRLSTHNMGISLKLEA